MLERLPEAFGHCINREREITFYFEGKSYKGYEGDTLSSALWANGVRVLGRSFKYHRPRGLFGLAGSDTNALVENDCEINMRGDRLAISEGLAVSAVNTRGGVAKDKLRFLDKLSAFTPVGFYYKAFHSKALFPFFEKRLRAVAGLGKVNTAKKMGDYSPKDYAFCDVLVVGSGPSGLQAALAAADAGAEVLLVEQEPHLGGSLCVEHASDEALLDRVCAHSSIGVRTATVVVGAYSDGFFALSDTTHLTKLRARAVVFATGAYEQPAVFRNNDVPGIMLATGALRLARLFGVRPFKRCVVLAANADAYRAAAQLLDAGVEIKALVDLRAEAEEDDLVKPLTDAGVVIRQGWCVYEAVKKKDVLVELLLCPYDGEADPASGERVAVDGLAMSVGWAPADGLLRQAGVAMRYAAAVEQFIPASCPDGYFVAGRANGIFALDSKAADGQAAGREAAAFLRLAVQPSQRPPHSGVAHSHPYPVCVHAKGKNFVDLDEDLTLKDFENAYQEGFDNGELMKRYSTVGMGASQGKHANLLAARILARLRGECMQGKELTTARPFVNPVPMGQLAGRIFTPRKHTSMHLRHEALGAHYMQAGVWLRAEYYRRDGLSRMQCIAEEVRSVREHIGLIDLGTLGKLEVSGPDAVAFLERIYTGLFTKLKVGMSRYGVACDESGVLIDDGVIARLAEDRFYVSTTSSGSDAVYRELQRWAIGWGLDVVLVNATNDYAAMNLAGPLAPKLLAPLTDVDLSAAAFPYLGVREGRVAEVPARLTRVGFVGELGYEIHVPVEGALSVWDALMAAGAPMGIRPFGVEAQRLLRLEKGHIIIGQDTDGLSHAYECGLGWAVKLKKAFFIGQRSLKILKEKGIQRQLVGFVLPSDYAGDLPKECHLVIDGGEIMGRVTSIARSPTLGFAIGLAYVSPAQAKVGTTIQIRLDGGQMIEATVQALPFFDPQGERQNMGDDK